MVKGPVDAVAARVLARQRHDVIVAEVRRRGAVRVSELSTLLAVSDMTVRRDLELLDEAGLLRKVKNDIIIVDAGFGSGYMPYRLVTQEFYQLCKTSS